MVLKQLRTFISVAETGALSKASDRLRIAQPALSRHIRLLEEEIGVELFVRHGRGMALTESGIELAERVGSLLIQLETSLDDIRAISEPSGRLTLGLFPSIVRILGARLIQRVARDLPRVSLRLLEAVPQHIIGGLQRGEIDIALLIGPAADLHLRTTGLLYEGYVVVGAANSTLQPDTPLALSQLGGYPLILPGPTQKRDNLVILAAKKAKVELDVRYEVDSIALTLEMVERGMGYTIVPISAVGPEVLSGRLRAAPLETPRLQRQLVLALPTNRADTRATTAVTKALVAEVASLIECGLWQAFPDEEVRNALESTSRLDGRLNPIQSAKCNA